MIFEDKHPLFEIYKKLLALRNDNKAFGYGNFRTVIAKDGLYGFERNFGNESIRVFINGKDTAKIPDFKGDVILSKNLSVDELKSFGYAVIKNTK